jgi:hypothetical protein
MGEGAGKECTGNQSYSSAWEKEASKVDSEVGQDQEEEEQIGREEVADETENIQGKVPQDMNVKGGVESGKNSSVKRGEEQVQASKKETVGNRNMQKGGCANCGLKNHTTAECRRNLFCEACGLANHTTLECKREPIWNSGPELCAAQVIDQSFFFIEENIDPKTAREKASIVVITVIGGEMTAKQIEMEFKNIVSVNL